MFCLQFQKRVLKKTTLCLKIDFSLVPDIVFEEQEMTTRFLVNNGK